MSILNAIELLSGIALFLYGVSLMGNGLNMAAGNKLELVLYRLTANPFKGLLLGALVTALIQSSSAASVMVVGFVNSGMMQFTQALYIILGSILGTSVTAWITSLSALGSSGGIMDLFSTAAITGIFAIAGIILYKFSKNKTKNHVGNILLGFAVLMTGMSAMSAAVSPLKESAEFIGFLTKFSNPALGIIAGMVFTCIIQSSAAAVGVLQALALTGALTFSTAFPIILGIAVGGAVPVLLSALGASTNGVRTALSHLLMDIFGALLCGILFYAVNAFVKFPFVDEKLSIVGVAVLNTAFRFATAILLFPLMPLIARIAESFVKDNNVVELTDIDKLEDRFIIHPALAIEQSHIVIDNMANTVKENLELAFNLLDNFSQETYEKVIDIENKVDHYEDALGTYLIKISKGELGAKQNAELYKFLHAITDFERISDHAMNIAENAKEIFDKQIVFSNQCIDETTVLIKAVKEIVDLVIISFVEEDTDKAKHIEPLEETIDDLCDIIKDHHVSRLQTGDCTLEHSFVFNDLLTNLERISDHCSNIGISIIESSTMIFDAHKYSDNLRIDQNHQFEMLFEEYSNKYKI